MILRNCVKDFGRPTPGTMVRVVKGPNGYIRYSQWKAAEDARLAQLEASKRMPASEREPYDLSYRTPLSSTKALGFDFSQ